MLVGIYKIYLSEYQILFDLAASFILNPLQHTVYYMSIHLDRAPGM